VSDGAKIMKNALSNMIVIVKNSVTFFAETRCRNAKKRYIKILVLLRFYRTESKPEFLAKTDLIRNLSCFGSKVAQFLVTRLIPLSE